MSTENKTVNVRKMTYLAIFSALVFVFQIIAIPVGGFFETSALPVCVIVIGAALFGIKGGAWLGFVFGIAVMILPGTQVYLTFGNNHVYSAICTIGVVFIKGILAGMAAGALYKLLNKFNRYVAVLTAGIGAVTTNTGIFVLGSVLFFDASFAAMMSIALLVSYLIELFTSILLAPIALRVINIKSKAKN